MRSRLALLLPALALAGCPDLPDPLAVDEEPPGADDLPDEVAMELPVCEGGVLNAFGAEAVQPPQAGSDGWLAPETDTLAAIRGSWTALIDADPLLAVGMVAVVGYQLCRGQDDEDDLVLWRPAVQGTGRALFTWRFRDARGAVIESPHGFVDGDGHGAALSVFDQTGARGLVASGTHPCANGEQQVCGAGSGMCDGLPSASDATVNDASIFQLAHELFAQSWPADWIVSLQAMEDEGIALSDGTLSGSELGAASAIGGEIVASLPDMLVTSCNGLLGATPGRRYCGTELVQARHSNDAAEICSAEAPDPSGRYLQITWSAEGRAQADVVAQAVDAGMAQDAR